jgi:hypothetical protein
MAHNVLWLGEEEIPIVYNNGSKSILIYGSSKRGVKKLRKLAKKCTITILSEKLPF